MEKEQLTGIIYSGLLNKSPRFKTLLYPIIEEMLACESEEELKQFNEHIATFCSHVRNSLEKDKTLNTKQISK